MGMGNKKMPTQKENVSKLYATQQKIIDVEKGAGQEVSAETDSELQNKFHDRSYNPINEAERGSVSAKLNEDAGRYKKGPGPV